MADEQPAYKFSAQQPGDASTVQQPDHTQQPARDHAATIHQRSDDAEAARARVRGLLEHNDRAFTPLIHSVTEFNQLGQAYLELRNEFPKPGTTVGIPRTDKECLTRIHKLYDAFLATDEAKDALHIVSGQPSQAMKFINGLKPFEIQQTLFGLELRMEAAQMGIYMLPSYNSGTKRKAPALYLTFDQRFNDVVLALTTRKSMCKSAVDDPAFAGRLARNPMGELKVKVDNDFSNGRKGLQIGFASRNMPEELIPEELRATKRRRLASDDNGGGSSRMSEGQAALNTLPQYPWPHKPSSTSLTPSSAGSAYQLHDGPQTETANAGDLSYPWHMDTPPQDAWFYDSASTNSASTPASSGFELDQNPLARAYCSGDKSRGVGQTTFDQQ